MAEHAAGARHAPILSRIPKCVLPVMIGTILTFGSAAEAVVTATLVQNNATTDLDLTGKIDPALLNADRIDVSTSGRNNSIGGVTFEALSSLDSDSILFKNGVIGIGTRSSATIGVAITFTNDSGVAYRPVLQSTLLAAGMGVGVTTAQAPLEFDPRATTLECNPAQLKNCGGVRESTLEASPYYFGQSSAGFEFDISVGDLSIYSLTGGVTTQNGRISTDFAQAQSVLNNFTSVRDDFYGVGYTWDDTIVDILFPEILAPGESVTAVYTIRTWVDVQAGGLSVGVDDRIQNSLLMGYASFGDPTGGKKTTTSRGMFNALADDGIGIDGINTSSYATFKLPTRERLVRNDDGSYSAISVFDGETTFVDRDPTPYGAPAGVPEPAGWAMMLAGFGLVGAVLRRRPGGILAGA
jgi:hypothetical protein